jgi:hypothetical protein
VALLLVLALASAGALLHRRLGFTPELPEAVTGALQTFLAPGLAAWWFLLGGAFQGFPSDAAGYVVTVAVNVVAWGLLVALVSAVVRHRRQADMPPGG